jgi:hypothetical protein
MQKNLITRQPLTPAICDDELWEVKTQDKTHRLSGKQIQILKTATTQGLRGLVWFDGFAISIPHITSINRIKNSKSKIDKKRLDLAKQFGFNQ